jgi:hypothetical protein
MNRKAATLSPKFVTSASVLISKLSFSHIREIMLQDDPLARFFYETECIKGTWSVRELRRQIATNLYFRSGVSRDPKKLVSALEPETNAEISQNAFIYRPFKDLPFSFCGYFAAITDGNLVHLLISL